MKRPSKKPNLSFIVPIRNEEQSLTQLIQEIESTCLKIKQTFEIIFIDDGSTDNYLKVIKKLKKKIPIRLIILRGNWGKSVALSVGFSKARGDIIFTIDGDLQDNPKEIPNFLKKMDEGYDLVSGWKKKRYDPLSKTLPSKIGNWITRTLTGVKSVHDLNCGFKAYKKELTDNLNLYGEMYKFIPIIAAKQNYKVTEIVVEHRKRKFGRSKFGWERNMKGLLDTITIVFLTTYFRRPGHFFGTIGVMFIIPGFLIGLYITYLRITTGGIDFRYPLLFLGALLMIVGVQFISTGLIAEMIIGSKDKQNYENIIKEEIL
jgi:glycosyltransferase involved in cell wall biosynthesis